MSSTRYERVAGAARDAGWEFMGHGFVQRPMHHLEDQRKAIFDTVDTIRAFTGRNPPGWESPGLTENEETLDLLKEAGIGYVANWVIDDLPLELATRHGPILSVPYTVETNDIVVHAVQHQPSDGFKRRSIDQFDRLWEEGAENAKVMAISTHPYLTGVPHRIRYFEELLDYVLAREKTAVMTGEEIADWYRGAMAGVKALLCRYPSRLAALAPQDDVAFITRRHPEVPPQRGPRRMLTQSESQNSGNSRVPGAEGSGSPSQNRHPCAPENAPEQAELRIGQDPPRQSVKTVTPAAASRSSRRRARRA